MQIFNFQFSIFNYFYYFCTVKRIITIIFLVLCTLSLCTSSAFGQTLDDIILDIYNAATELSEVDYEQLQSDLYAIHESPIDLNATSDEELSQLYFLSPRQIDDILAYAYEHPFHELYELRLIPSLADYEIRDLLPFVKISNVQSPISNNKMYAREVFAFARHEIITRVDARNIESFEGTDPVYIQTRYRFDYQRKVIFGVQLRRPAGGHAQDLQYGAYLQLRDITPHLHTLVAGNFQASFGQGLVLAPVFHSGKSMYIQSIGQTTEGLRYYSSVDGEGLHGAGATIRHSFNAHTRLDVSALYSLKHTNDTLWHHLLGANITLRHKQLQVQLTAIENLWSDSIHPYNNAAYNHHYFRGRNQAVMGASARYNYGWFDAFAELATAQNYDRFAETSPSQITNDKNEVNRALAAEKSQITNDQSKWGIGLIAGSRFYPASGLSLIALYRYYSPFFDNALGYSFSETSRLGDENGGYLGFDITRLSHWRFSGYGDVFRFSGPKYGIPVYPSIGYDAMFETQYHSPITNLQSSFSNHQWSLLLRARARQKGNKATYSTRLQCDILHGPWSFRTNLDANIVDGESSISIDKRQTTNDQSPITYGVSLFQDIAYDFQSPMSGIQCPLSLRLRLQFFDARNWDNRIYAYEHDVLYAYSIPAVYGLGGRAYLCLRWQIIPQLALYFRFSETLYARDWYLDKHPQYPISNLQYAIPSRTDFHLLLRAKL